MTKGLTAWKFYLKKFPTASSDDACALLNLIGSCGSLQGAYTASAADKWSARKKKSEKWTDTDVEEWLQHIEDIAHPRFSMDYVLEQYFGIVRKKGTVDEYFDPIELKDSFGYNKTVIQLFRKRDRELENET